MRRSASGSRRSALCVLAGEVACANAQKVVDACAGLDVEACLRVDAELAGRLASMDPARVTSEARKVAARVAADQVAAHAAKTRRGRCVEVRPGVDGLTDWFASLPTATSAAMWSAVEELAGQYRQVDTDLSEPESRADALADLVLRNVTVRAQVTLGVPVVTDRPAPDPAPGTRFRVEWDDDETVIDAVTGEETRYADLDPASREALSWLEEPAELDGDLTALDGRRSTPGTRSPVRSSPASAGSTPPPWRTSSSSCRWRSPAPSSRPRPAPWPPSPPSAYRPPKAIADFVKTRDGTCRMWGCSRPAERCDLDHTRPWPEGATTPTELESLCRRHHRFKQTGRWRPDARPRRHPHLARPERRPAPPNPSTASRLKHAHQTPTSLARWAGWPASTA